MNQIKAMQLALDALLSHVRAYPHMDKGYMVDAREALHAALAETSLQQHASAYQEMERFKPIGERAELIDGLRMNAAHQGRNEKFGTQKLLLKAADMLVADAAWYQKGDALFGC
jgi:hypothetical protein